MKLGKLIYSEDTNTTRRMILSDIITKYLYQHKSFSSYVNKKITIKPRDQIKTFMKIQNF